LNDALSVTTTYRWTATSRPTVRIQKAIAMNIENHLRKSVSKSTSLVDPNGLTLPGSQPSPFPSCSIDPMAATAFRLHPAAFFSAHPREAGAKRPLRHCPPHRILVPRRACLLRAKSSNGLPQIGASFGNTNEVVPAEVLDGRPAGAGPPEQGGSTVSITVVGASGDLAKKKIFPALFALFYEDCLPEHFTVFGYARSKMNDAELRTMISRTLTCRIDKRENCGDKMEQFLQRCFYQPGQYNAEEGFAELDRKLKEKEVPTSQTEFGFIFEIQQPL